jgi:hypothetical protein
MKTYIQRNGSRWIVGLFGSALDVEEAHYAFYAHGATNSPRLSLEGEDAEGNTLGIFYTDEKRFTHALRHRAKTKMFSHMEDFAKADMSIMRLGTIIAHKARYEAAQELKKAESVSDLFKRKQKNDFYDMGSIKAERPDYDGTDSDMFQGHKETHL